MNKKSIPVRLIVTMLLFSASFASAQGLADDVSAVSVGMPLTVKGNFLSEAQLQTVKGSSSVAVKLSRVQSLRGNGDAVQFNTWSFVASAPLNRSGDDTTIANLDGLANSASIEIGFANFNAQGKRQPTYVISKTVMLDAICRRAYENRRAKDGTEVPQNIGGCDSNLLNTYGSQEDKHSFESAFWDLGNSNRWLWGANAKFGYQDLEYITTSSTQKQRLNETPWAVSLWGAVQPGDRQLILSVTMQYQRGIKEGNIATICPVPAPSSASVSCLTGPLESPKQVTKKLLTLEIRARPADIGVALTVTRDFQAKVTGVELPVYFVVDKDSKLTAGFKAGWRSDTNIGGLGFFVGLPFGLYK